MEKTQTQHKQQELNALLDIFATPVRIDGALQSILTDREESAKLINQFLKDAMVNGLLPREVVIAQFVGVPPKRQSSYLDLRNLILVREDCPRRNEMLQGYAFTVGGLKLIEWSFHKAITWDCYGPAGSAIIFALNQEQPSKSFFDRANLFWVDYQLAAPPEMPFLRNIKIGNQSDSALELVPILEDAHNIRIIKNAVFPMGRYSCTVRPKAGLSKTDEKQVTNFHRNILLKKTDYFRYCLPSVTLGDIMLAAPRPAYFTDAEQHEGLGDSGLAVVFEPGHKISPEDVERVYFVAQRVNNVFASLYSLAQGQQHQGAANAFRMITHSLGNAILYARRGPDEVERVLKLESYTAAAAGSLYSRKPILGTLADNPWETAGCEIQSKPESLDESIRRGTFLKDENFTIEAGCMKGKRTDPRFIALLVELARNMEQHSLKRSGTISLRTGTVKSTITLRLESDSDYCYPRDLPDKFRLWRESREASRGLDFIWLLLHSLVTDSTSISFYFGAVSPRKKRGEPILVHKIPITFGIDHADAVRFSRAEKDGDTDESFVYVLEIHNLQTFL